MGDRRKVLWYGIISYVSDVLKGEILNVGLLANLPENAELRYTFLSENNSKLKSLVVNKHDKKVYRSGTKYLNYLLDSVDNNDLSFSLNPESKDFISMFSSFDMPHGFKISSPRYAKVSDPELFIEHLKKIYIGETFLNEEYGTNSMQVKRKATSIIEGRSLAINKIKKNIQIKPVPKLPKNYTLDFGYTVGQKVNLIDATPDKLSTAYDWLERMNFITDNYDESDKITLLYNSNSESNLDGTLKNMLDYLTVKDERVETIDIFSQDGERKFLQEIRHIEQFAGDMKELEQLIA